MISPYHLLLLLLLHQLQTLITSHSMNSPHIEPPQVNPNETPATFASLLVQLYKPHFKEAISSLSADVLVIDFFATTLIDVAGELGNIPTYIYFTSNAAMLALILHLPTLDEEIHQDFEELEEGVVVQVPGLPPIPPRTFPVSIASKKKQSYAWYLYHSRRFSEARGIIVNTFKELEEVTLQSLSQRANIYSVGPVVCRQREEDGRHECMKWLDEQPVDSVVFLCFGSRGSFGEEQVREMAEGIERSGKRFLWVMKGLERWLPEGFEERNKERGVVWKERVPQVEVLSHRAVGGFVTHCGWNSVMESLWFGVPMMTWPLYAEQYMNAWLMVREWGVGVELRVERDGDGGGLVKKEEIENGVRCLMEEEKVRVRVMEMKSVCRKVVSGGGSSFLSFQGLVEDVLFIKSRT